MINFFKDSGLETSYLRDLSSKCDAINGINLSQGICDDGTPSILLDEACIAIMKGNNSYSSHFGANNLRDAIVWKYYSFNKINISQKNVVVCSGATGGFICTCIALFEKGDEVILFEPFYPYHVITLKALGINPIICKYDNPDEQTIDFELLQGLVTSNTKAILLCTPANPSGKVLTKSELEEFGLIIEKFDLYLISDEIYEYITYFESHPHISPASIKSLQSRTITISGFSKTFAVTGWRVGYVIAHHTIISRIALVNDFYYICAPTPLQHALSQVLQKIDATYFRNLSSVYFGKMNYALEMLTEAGFSASIPYGAYYLMCKCAILPGESSLDKALYLLNKTGIAAVPGQNFYLSPADGNDVLRVCFSKSLNILEEARDRLALL